VRVGVLPAVGNGLRHFQATGQLPRLFAHLEGYQGDCTYFTYQEFLSECDLWRDELGDLVGPMRPMRRPLRYALKRPLLEAQMFRECDVLRCTSLLGAVPAIVARAIHRLPFVFTYGADYLAIAGIHGRSRLHLRKWRFLQGVAMRLASAVIVQNEAMRAKIQTTYPAARVVHLPNWVDTNRFKPEYREAGHTVLYVGRLVEEKNLMALATACATTNFALTCIGEGPVSGQLAGFAAITKAKIRLPGAVPWGALPEWYPRHAIFAMVSKTEGHCKALAEAMAAGMTCVVSKEVTEGMEPGVNCLQVDGDPTSIALALEVLVIDRDFAAKLGWGARKTALQLWGKAELLRRERDLLREVAGR